MVSLAYRWGGESLADDKADGNTFTSLADDTYKLHFLADDILCPTK